MPTKTIVPGLCRFDFEERKTHGFMVRIMRRGKMIQEFFSDKRYGGKRKARASAEARLQELRETLPAPGTTKDVLTARNTSGTVGIHVAHDVDKRWPDCEYWSYVASWLSDEGKRINVKFSWKKYGERLALQLATIARERKLRDREEILAIQKRRLARKKALAKAKRKPK